MTFHRFTIIRLSRSLLALLISLQVVACGSSTVESVNPEESTGGIADLVARLNWIAPSEREDGTPISLSEIAGYRVYYSYLADGSLADTTLPDTTLPDTTLPDTTLPDTAIAYDSSAGSSSAGKYPNKIDIMDSSAVQASLSGLSPGSYYFVVTVIDTDGRESRFSEEVPIAI